MNINQIIEKLTTDKELSERYAALKGVDAILEQAKADGFDVSREDVETVFSKIGGLSEDELAVVAGGAPRYKHCSNCGRDYSSQHCPHCCDECIQMREDGRK